MYRHWEIVVFFLFYFILLCYYIQQVNLYKITTERNLNQFSTINRISENLKAEARIRESYKNDTHTHTQHTHTHTTHTHTHTHPNPIKKKLIPNHHNFFLTSVQVILEPYCFSFCVLSNDMLNVSISTFS